MKQWHLFRGRFRNLASTRLFWLLAGLATIVPISADARQPEPEKETTRGKSLGGEAVAGWVERVWIGDKPVMFEAKLDTGANSSSINVPNAKKFMRDGKEWIRLGMTNEKGERFDQDVPVDRYILIRRAGAPKHERAIVVLEMCIAGKSGKSEFTVADRTGQSYQVLVGRKFLKGRLLVDSGRTNLSDDSCSGIRAK